MCVACVLMSRRVARVRSGWVDAEGAPRVLRQPHSSPAPAAALRMVDGEADVVVTVLSREAVGRRKDVQG